jgi:hypothetical protein
MKKYLERTLGKECPIGALLMPISIWHPNKKKKLRIDGKNKKDL